jgi:hypothetical protein
VQEDHRHQAGLTQQLLLTLLLRQRYLLLLLLHLHLEGRKGCLLLLLLPTAVLA